MDSDLNEDLTISLPRSVLLVLFELLTKSYIGWRKENINDSSAGPMAVVADEHAERVSLWRLEGAIESALPEIFAANYQNLVEEAKRRLKST